MIQVPKTDSDIKYWLLIEGIYTVIFFVCLWLSKSLKTKIIAELAEDFIDKKGKNLPIADFTVPELGCQLGMKN